MEVQALKEELAYTKAKLSHWEQSLKQARSAWEAWKKEAEEWKARAQAADQELSAILMEKQQVRMHRVRNVPVLAAALTWLLWPYPAAGGRAAARAAKPLILSAAPPSAGRFG